MLSVQLIPCDKVHGFIPIVIEKRSVKRNALMRQTEFQETKKDPDIDMIVYDKSILRHDADRFACLAEILGQSRSRIIKNELDIIHV